MITAFKTINIVEYNILLQKQLTVLANTGKLFRSTLTGDKLWDSYIKSFKNDPVFRDPNSSFHNCNLCNNFIRRYGNIVAINSDNQIITLFDFEVSDPYVETNKKLSNLLKKSDVGEVFFETFNELNSLNYESCKKTNSVFRLGLAKNVKRYTAEEAEKYGVVKANEIITFNHLHIDIPALFVDTSGKSIDQIMAFHRDNKNVFKRAMDEISLDTLLLVKDLILQNSLLDGQTHLHKLEAIIPLKTAYDKLAATEKDNWCWVNSYNFTFSKFKNELIGVLCSELSEGKDLNKACQDWNKRVDPANYMKATAPITKKQIEEARKFVEENGYEESFKRRFAVLDDIRASEILHMNKTSSKIKSVSVFDNVKSTSTRHKRAEYDNVEEITIDKFMTDILPNATSLHVLLLNKHQGNLVTLTTADNKDSKPIFKWDNNFSWTYNGNIAGKSLIKDNVKAAGGNIEALLRCSLQWNDEDTKGIVDFDLHCKTPFDEINYSNKNCYSSKGWLDVDMINPSNVGIENITWQKQLKDGKYDFFVRNFNGNSNNGFKVEIELNGETFNYYYSNPVSYKQDIKIATVTVKDGNMTIKHLLPETSTSKDLWNLKTNEFHKVNLVCLSPNHWQEQGVGNKHYFFMLNNCKTDLPIRGFHNENLNSDLLQHRKVMEVLGSTTFIDPSDEQLSGLGFNATVKDELIIKVEGSFKRLLKIKF